jgi:hypothetical protein
VIPASGVADALNTAVGGTSRVSGNV